MLAGPDWLKAHKGDLHGQDQSDDVEGAVGWRRDRKVNDELISKDLKLISEEESLRKSYTSILWQYYYCSFLVKMTNVINAVALISYLQVLQHEG